MVLHGFGPLPEVKYEIKLILHIYILLLLANVYKSNWWAGYYKSMSEYHFLMILKWQIRFLKLSIFLLIPRAYLYFFVSDKKIKIIFFKAGWYCKSTKPNYNCSTTLNYKICCLRMCWGGRACKVYVTVWLGRCGTRLD